MRFMMMVKHPENSGPPPKALMDAMERIGQEAVKNGTMVISGGLAPTVQSHRVRLSGGGLFRLLKQVRQPGDLQAKRRILFLQHL